MARRSCAAGAIPACAGTTVGYTPSAFVSTDTPTNVSLRPEVVAEFGEFWPSGVAVSPSGRIFVSFPRLDARKASATLVELRRGAAVPFSDELVNAMDDSDRKHRFV